MNRHVTLGYFFLVASVLLWAGNSTIGRATGDATIPPIAFNFWRWTVALAIFLMLSGRELWRLRATVLAHWKYMIAFSLISVAGFNIIFYVGLQNTQAIQCGLIQSILPVLVLLIGLVFMRERITGKQWLGVVFSIGGAGLIVARGDLSVLGTLELNTGDAWCLAAVFIWAIQATMLRWKPREIPILPFMTALSMISVIAMLPLYLWETQVVGPMPVTMDSILFVLYVAVFASVLGTTMFNEGTYRVGAATAGYFANLFPIFAGILAILILGETPYWYHGVGTALVLAGIYLATMARRNRPAATAG